MKTKIIISLVVLSLSAFTTNKNAASQLGTKLTLSLKKQSLSDFIALAPSLEDYHRIMEAHEELYGNNLEEAKADFANTYYQQVLPQLIGSFNRIVFECQQKNIDLTQAITQVQVSKAPASKYAKAILTITVTDHKYKQKLKFHIMDALFMNGNWKISPQLKFE